MSATIICLHCKKEVLADSRQKSRQQYCGEPDCQRARKAAWQRNKIATDAAYRERQKACQDRWRQSRPLHQYQRAYRDRNPDYVERNRELQRIRKRKRRERRAQPDLAEKIVKMDASGLAPIPAGTYELRPFAMDASPKIVKMDAWIVQLKTVSSVSLPNPS